MATNNTLELQNLSDDELKGQLASTEADYQKLVFDHAVSGLSNPMEIRAFRRNIARMKTEVRRRELANMSEEELAMRSNIRRRRRK